jgi:PAS domain-containing protein
MAQAPFGMSTAVQPSDFVAFFHKSPGMCLILDANFTLIAQNEAHAAATMTRPRDTIGRSLFEVFPDNPNDSTADGLSYLRQSLLNVLKTRATDTIETLKFDIERPLSEGGGFDVRYWRVVNTPVLGEDGFVRWIINSVDDITELTLLRENVQANNGGLAIAGKFRL